MPTYAYRCKKCGKPFTLTLPIREHQKKRVRCLKCGSHQVAKLGQPFHVTTSKKS